MSNIVFVQDGAIVSAPANYGMVDSSIGGQLARKMIPSADGRTRRGLVSINNMRDRIGECLKSYANSKSFVHGSRLVIG